MSTIDSPAAAPRAEVKPTTAYLSSERVEQVAGIWLAEAEEHRREKPSMDAVPLPVRTAETIDYGRSGQQMELAMAHLRESVPNGQRLRTEAAARALMYAVEQQVKWLREKGYSV